MYTTGRDFEEKRNTVKQSPGGELINKLLVEGFQQWICKGKSWCQKPSNAGQVGVKRFLYDNLFCNVFTIQINVIKMHTCFNKNADYSLLLPLNSAKSDCHTYCQTSSFSTIIHTKFYAL
jgi:hypothetical protein